MPSEPRWQFPRMRRGELNVDPIQGEFFSTEVLGSVADALVRESIQNSLDARSEEGPVRVRFAFARLPAEEGCLEGLWPHLLAPGNGLDDAPEPGARVSCLAIEDFATRGLRGDPRQYEDVEEQAERNDFYYFWRNIGRSGKSAGDRGRWGLGKTVFQAASRINAFFGLTCREGAERLLMGQAVLRIHKVDGQRHAPYGYYAQFEDELALPVADPPRLDRFAASFGLARGEEPGLSVVVPFPERSITLDSISLAVVRQYVFPLVRGELVVEVADGQTTRTFDAETLERTIRGSFWPDRLRLLELVELARFGLGPPAEAHATLLDPPEEKAPKLELELWREGDLVRLRRQFEQGRRIAVTVPVHVIPRAGGRAVRCTFDVLLERRDGLDQAEEHFVRDGITVPDVSGRVPRGIRSIVTISDRTLSAFLGDSENPAHTEWQRNSPHFRGKYQRGVSTLDFVKAAAREIVRLLTLPAGGRDPGLLRELFSLSRPEPPPVDPAGQQRIPGLGPERLAEAAGEEEGEIAAGAATMLYRVKQGFRLAGRRGAAPPAGLLLTLAYEVRRGNPFAHYVPLDFEIGRAPLVLRSSGVRVVEAGGNRLELDVLELEFEVVLRGFDPHRDLRIRVEERSA